ncbi:MAG: dTMP kinase [Pseudomonadota bacterium]
MAAGKRSGQGFLITLEGGEGAGKSSQISLLAERFEELGYPVVTTREPGGTTGAEIIRHVLLSGAAEPFGEHLEAILFAAARADHVEQLIRPALEAGKIVICDRYIDSTRVYQGLCGKVDPEFLKDLEYAVCEGAWPDLTIVLDLDPKTGMARANKRRSKTDKPDRFEKDTLKLQKQRRNAFLQLAKEEPERIKVVSASGSMKQVAARVWKTTTKHLSIEMDSELMT